MMRQRILSGLQWIVTLAAGGLAGAVFWQQSALLHEIKSAHKDQRALSAALKRLFPEHSSADQSSIPGNQTVDATRPSPQQAPAESNVNDVARGYYAPTTANPPPTSDDGAPANPQPQSLIVKLVQGTLEGPPVTGAHVSIQGNRSQIAEPEKIPFNAVRQGDGVRFFEVVDKPTGRYIFQLEQPDRFELKVWLLDGQECKTPVLVRPKEHRELTIICPKPREQTIVNLTAPPLPKDLQARNCELEVNFSDDSTTLDGIEWRSPGGHSQTVTFDPQGGPVVQILHLSDGNSIDLRRARPEDRVIVVLSGSLQYSFHLSPRLDAGGSTPVAVWPNRVNERQLTRQIEPGEVSWQLELPDELLRDAKEMFVRSRPPAAYAAPAAPAPPYAAAPLRPDAANAAKPLGNFCRLTVKLASETKDGPIPEGAHLELSDENGRGFTGIGSDRTSTCYDIEAGRYMLEVNFDDGRETQIKLPVLRPGQDRTEVVVCPPPLTKAALLVTAPPVPDDLRKAGVQLRARVDLMDVELDGRQWTLQRNCVRYLVFHPETGRVEQAGDLDLRNEAPQDRLLFLPAGPYRQTFDIIALPSPETRPNDKSDFTAEAGENKWEMKVPDTFWGAVREMLRTNPPRAPKPAQ